MSQPFARNVVLLAFLLLAVWRATVGWLAFPIPDGDAAAFLPHALGVLRGYGLTNVFWSRGLEIDPIGEGRLIWHGFLYPLALSWFAPKPSAAGVLAADGLLGGITIFVAGTCVLLTRRWRADSTIPVSHVVLAILGATAIAAVVTSTAGRPESLCVLFVALIGRMLARPAPWRDAVIGVLLGALAVTSPVVAAMAGCFVMIVRASASDWRGAWRTMALTAVPAAATAALCFVALYPWSMTVWIQGMLTHSTVALTGTNAPPLTALAHYMIANPATPGIGALVLLAIGAIAKPSWRSPLALAALVALLALAGVFVIRSPEKVYYLGALVPLWLFAVLHRADDSNGWRLVSSATCLALSVGLLVSSLQFVHYVARGISLERARADFLVVSQTLRSPVAASTALWVLTDERRLVERSESVEAETLVLQQANSGLLAPEPVNGYALKWTNFRRTYPAIGRIRIGNAPKGYSFAVYVKQHGDPP